MQWIRLESNRYIMKHYKGISVIWYSISFRKLFKTPIALTLTISFLTVGCKKNKSIRLLSTALNISVRKLYDKPSHLPPGGGCVKSKPWTTIEYGQSFYKWLIRLLQAEMRVGASAWTHRSPARSWSRCPPCCCCGPGADLHLPVSPSGVETYPNLQDDTTVRHITHTEVTYDTIDTVNHITQHTQPHKQPL